jgi:hypothetical protein
MLSRAALLLFFLLVGCTGATKVVRLDTQAGAPIIHVPRRNVEPVDLSEAVFKAAMAEHAYRLLPAARPLESARQWFGVPERSGWYRYKGTKQPLTLLGPEDHQKLELSPADAELKHRYLRWCERTWGPGDCLRLLVDSPMLDGDGKYALAMAIAHSRVLGAMKDELGRLVNPMAVVATVVGGMTMYAILLAMPEPVTKGVAALMTLGAVAYLGWDTVWRLIEGWFDLMREVDRAATFEEIQASGDKFGDVMGEKAARAFVMLATVAMGNTAAGMAAKLPTLPGAAQAAVMAEEQSLIRYTSKALSQVESVSITAQGATITLAPGAVAMATRGMQGNQHSVYVSVNSEGKVQYVGITNDVARRAAEHLRQNGFQIEELLGSLSREEARAVEQVLIEIHGLGKTGGTLTNRINSIAQSNPEYAKLVHQGRKLLESIGYKVE